MFTKLKSLFLGLLFLVFGIVLGYGSLLASFDLQEDVTIEEPFDFLPLFHELEGQGRIGEAINLGRWINEYPEMPNSEKIEGLASDLEEEHNSLVNRSKRLWRGFWTGEYVTQEDAIGALTSDILFIGDIRDLSKQALNKYNDKEVDEFIVVLSTAGLASSVATFFPEPSSTSTGIAAEAGITLLKGLKKSGALTSDFSRLIKSLIKEPRKLAKVLEELARLSKNSPPGTVPFNLRGVDNLDDLKALNRGLDTDPRTTTVILSRAEQAEYGKLTMSKSKLVHWAKHKIPKVKIYTRVGKLFYTGRFVEFLRHVLLLRILCGFLSVCFIAFGYFRIKKAFV